MADPYEFLGVNRDITKGELKKIYRMLLKKYHPDSTKTGDTEKCKEINLAYDAIINDISMKAKTINLSPIKQEKMSKLKSYFEWNNTGDEKLESIKENIQATITFISISQNIKDIDRLFAGGMQMIIYFYQNYVRDIFEKEGIIGNPEDYIQNNLNYEASFVTMKEQLTKYIYNHKLQYKKEVSSRFEEIFDLESYFGYDVLKLKIYFIKTSYSKKIKETKKEIEIEELLKLMTQEIEELFNLYYERLKRLEYLEEISDVKYKDFLCELRLNIMSPNFEEKYQKLNAKVVKTNRQDYFAQNIETMNSLYQAIALKSYNKLTNLSLTDNSYLIYHIQRFSLYITYLFMEAAHGWINPVSLKRLNKLNFNDPIADACITQSVEFEYSHFSINNLFVKKDGDNYYLAWLDCYEDGYYMNHIVSNVNGKPEIKQEKIALSKIKDNYYLIDEIINENYYCGKKNISQEILYIYKDCMIYLNENGEIELAKKNVHFDVTEILEYQYKNKDYIISLITEQVNKLLDEQMDMDDSPKV